MRTSDSQTTVQTPLSSILQGTSWLDPTNSLLLFLVTNFTFLQIIKCFVNFTHPSLYPYYSFYLLGSSLTIVEEGCFLWRVVGTLLHLRSPFRLGGTYMILRCQMVGLAHKSSGSSDRLALCAKSIVGPHLGSARKDAAWVWEVVAGLSSRGPGECPVQCGHPCHPCPHIRPLMVTYLGCRCFPT